MKINGLIQVIVKKIESTNNTSDKYVAILSRLKSYLENYDFEREISTISTMYSEDPNRLRNIRLKILESFQDKKLMEKIRDFFEEGLTS